MLCRFALALRDRSALRQRREGLSSPGAKPRVVIVGAGFGGLYAAKALRKSDAAITVVDRRNHHLFQPLLYQVATAGLNPSDIAAPIRSILRRQKNTDVLLGDVQAVDRKVRRVLLSDGMALDYDYLIVATGATHSYFGHDDWAANAPGLKSIEDALEIRRRVLIAYEAAEKESDPDLRAAWLTFVVVGAGPTGVELAGALSEIARKTMIRDFRHINPADARVILVEASSRVLPVYPEDLSEKAAAQLRALRVEVLVDTRVTGVSSEGVTLGESKIAARTVLWAAGVQASALARSLDAKLDRAGRVEITENLTLPDDDRVFVIGDLAALVQPDGSLVPGVAPAAIQEGQHAAYNIGRAIRGLPMRGFRYVDKGSLATIGRAAAVADFGKVHLSGLIAWLAWLVIHVFLLIGFRNRVLVITQWAFAYLSYQRGARLITGGKEAKPM
jgi:NADH dehydrogenase